MGGWEDGYWTEEKIGVELKAVALYMAVDNQFQTCDASV